MWRVRDFPFSAVLVDFFHQLYRDFNFNMTSSLSSTAMIKLSAGRALRELMEKGGY